MKILVIEDEKLLADSIDALLSKKGFEVEVAYDGETGAEYAELGIYDLLILDVMMPKKSTGKKMRNSHFNADGKIRIGRPYCRVKCRRRLLSRQAF